MNENIGKLYIVSTPIGNLGDITYRAIETLKNVDLIAAEDTRRTKELLNYFSIDTKLTSYHEHNKYDKAVEIVEKIKSGTDVAVVTDAGTPVISDPGNELIKRAIEEEITITAIPGACAAINALVLSGFDARSFMFVGFLYDDNKKRKEQLDELKSETRTMIFYISVHDILKDLKSFIQVFGEDRCVSVAREMTKVYEEIKRGTLKEIYEYFKNKEAKGEFVLVVSGLDKELKKSIEVDKWLELSINEHYQKYIDEGLSEKDAMKKVALDRNQDKREIYRAIKVK